MVHLNCLWLFSLPIFFKSICMEPYQIFWVSGTSYTHLSTTGVSNEDWKLQKRCLIHTFSDSEILD